MDAARFRNSSLVLAAHGSHLNPQSAEPCYVAADQIRKRNIFGEVHECFWKQEPAFRHVSQLLGTTEAFVVPFFISDGYFTETVLPRELGVTPPSSIVDGKTIHYCKPVGTHDAMTEVILQRARTILARSGADSATPASTALFIAGHGTDKNENSAKSILRQVELIGARHEFAEVHAVFMDQEPGIARAHEIASTRDLVVVPFFISDGLHTQEDIPGMLSLVQEPAGKYRVPSLVRGKRIWYCGAVGTDPSMADVVLARAMQAASH